MGSNALRRHPLSTARLSTAYRKFNAMKLTVGLRIVLGFAVVLVVQLVVGFFAYRTTTGLIANSDQVTHTHEVLGVLADLLSLLKDAETGQRGYLLTERIDYLEPYDKAGKEIALTLERLRKLTLDNEHQQKRLEVLSGHIDAKLAELANTIRLNQTKQREKALEIVLGGEGKRVMDSIRKVVGEMEEEEYVLLKQRALAANADADVVKRVILFGSLTAVLITAAAALAIQRSITTPLGRFMQFVERVGQGDLTGQIPDTNVTDLQRLGESLTRMVAGLKDLAGQINSATQNLNGAAQQILASVQETAAGTRQQAASVQQITATVEEVGQSGSQIAERAKQVAAAAEATASTTSVGLKSVQVASRAMESIREQVETFAEHIVALSEKTQAVGEIIGSVTDVAERSNLLALNASIEAAGAGEHGGRFAVVAGEMKNLADQAKESTVQVQTILVGIQKGINSSVMLTEEAVKRAEAGREQAQTTERTIRQMADTTQESVNAFQQIIAATNQQQIGLDQVTQGMKDIRQAATQTAAATSQLEAAVVNVTALSQQLQKAAGRYRL